MALIETALAEGFFWCFFDVFSTKMRLGGVGWLGC